MRKFIAVILILLWPPIAISEEPNYRDEVLAEIVVPCFLSTMTKDLDAKVLNS